MAPAAGSRAAALRTARSHAEAGRSAEGEAIYRQLPADADVLLAWGQLRRESGDPAAARELLERAITAGGGVSALVALADLHLDRQDLAAAQPLAQRAMALAPRSAGVHLLIARAAEMTGKLDAATTAYRAAMHADPMLLAARLGLGRVLASQGRDEEVLACYAALLKRWPRSVEALLALGRFHGARNRFHDALACFEKAEAAGADVIWHLSTTAMALTYACDWGAPLTGLRRRLDARLRQTGPCLVDAYAVVCHEDDPSALLRLGERISGAVAAHLAAHVASLPRPAIVTATGDRPIRVGYLSGDFNQHALSLLMAEVFSHHDRGRFAVTAYSYSVDDGSETRRRVVAGFDRFVELGLEPPAESARRIAADGVDILVDLKGYAEGGRPEIQALRPAHIQVTHLGYQATLGAPWVDYVLADAVVAPFDGQPDWSERIVHLPDSYFPNDRRRPVPGAAPSRSACGLPASGIVFACFNQTFKITEPVFAVWMDLLRDVPGSVLWLYRGNPEAPAQAHLRAAAARGGIAPERLVFADAVSLADHLARHACADMFLDTAPYGAHTTGCDALWAGLPLVTCMGRSFASRVGASLLRAVGMPELIAETYADYRAIALRLAHDSAALAGLRARLIAARATAPLFDAARFARGLDAAYLTMMDLHRAGAAPRGFAIDGEFQPVHQPA